MMHQKLWPVGQWARLVSLKVKPKSSPRKKREMLKALDQAMESLEASALESQVIEARLKVVEERGFGFTDEQEKQAWNLEWKEAWKNKFIQEKALKAAVRQLETAMSSAREECPEHSLLKWLCVTISRIDGLIANLEESMQGFCRPLDEDIKFASDHLIRLRNAFHATILTMPGDEVGQSPVTADSQEKGSKRPMQPGECAPVEPAPCQQGTDKSGKVLQVDREVADGCCKRFNPSHEQDVGQCESMKGLGPLGLGKMGDSQVENECRENPRGKSQEGEGAEEKSRSCVLQAFERSLHGGEELYLQRSARVMPPPLLFHNWVGQQTDPSSVFLPRPTGSACLSQSAIAEGSEATWIVSTGDGERISREIEFAISGLNELEETEPILLQLNGARVSFFSGTMPDGCLWASGRNKSVLVQ